MKTYKELLKIIKEYEKLKVWKEISGDDVFKIAGYKTPIYVSILGKLGSCNEINIYVGKEELYDQYDILYGEYHRFPDSYLRVACYKLIVEEAYELLTEESEKILKKNHLKTEQAVLRLDKGKIPRLITEEEAEFLLPIAKDILKIAEYIKEEKLEFPEKVDITKQYVFSVKDKVTHKIEKFESGHEISAKVTEMDQDVLNKVLIFSQKGTFGVGLFYGPLYIQEEKAYSHLLIIVDMDSQRVLDMQVIPTKDVEDVMNYLLKSFLKIQKYPENIAFASTELLLQCQNLIPELKMNYKVDNQLDMLFDVWKNLQSTIGKK